jgi:hypothetical protein
MKLILSRILMRADLRLDDGYVPRAKWIGNFLGPAKDVPVRFTSRGAN